jgi:hypothetical protein
MDLGVNREEHDGLHRQFSIFVDQLELKKNICSTASIFFQFFLAVRSDGHMPGNQHGRICNVQHSVHCDRTGIRTVLDRIFAFLAFFSNGNSDSASKTASKVKRAQFPRLSHLNYFL